MRHTPKLSAEQIQRRDPVEFQRYSSGRRVRDLLGWTVQTAADGLETTGEVVGYGAGRLVGGIGRIQQATRKGFAGEPFHAAA